MLDILGKTIIFADAFYKYSSFSPLLVHFNPNWLYLVSQAWTIVYLALYNDNTDIHFNAYLLVCANEVLYTMSACD